MNNNKCHVLAPAGNMDVLKAAIYAGSDYVYISGKNYGARAFADNFDYNQLKEAIKFAHDNNVKIFVTVNVSILECEITDVLDYIYFLYVNGADAVIIQDIGLASIISELIPDLDIHASTQMTIYDYSFVKWLSENNYSNANLSREVPLSRIKDICDKIKEYNHDIQIEVFAHGALCYCYSGECLMSSFLGGRSGNRGLCAQPCRMRYTLEDKYHINLSDSEYLLSTKDLCTYPDINRIVDSGVDSLKIEGRMKSIEYVVSSVNAYKNAVNGIYNDDDYLLLNLAFNRGLTEGYILENMPDNVVGRSVSGSQGYPIGRVTKIKNSKVTIKFINRKFPTKLVNGDGIKFEYEGESCGMYVSKIFKQSKNQVVILANKDISIYEDAMVYITYSKYLHDKTKSIINEERVNKIPLNLSISINDKKQMSIKCSYANSGKSFIYHSDDSFDEAQNRPLTNESINKQLRKTGNTNFTIETIDYENFYDNLFMPTSTLNNIRRNIIELADKNIKKSNKPSKKEKEIVKNNIQLFKEEYYAKVKAEHPKDKKINVCVNNIKQVELIKDYNYINSIYYDASYNYDNIEDYVRDIYDELASVHEIIGNDKELVWVLPQLLLDKDIPHISEILVKLQFNNINVKIQSGDIGVVKNLDATCYGANNLNIYNNYTIKKLSQDKLYERLIVSNEISLEDIKLLDNIVPLEYVIFGNIQVMISEDNFEKLTSDYPSKYYYLKDKKNHRFKLVFDCYNHSHIFDYRTLNLADKLEQLNNTAVEYLNIDLKFFNENDTKNIIDYFEKIMKKEKETNPLNNREYFTGNFKKGLYKNKQ